MTKEENINQCDGCQRGLPVGSTGWHFKGGRMEVKCTKDRYEKPEEKKSFHSPCPYGNDDCPKCVSPQVGETKKAACWGDLDENGNCPHGHKMDSSPVQREGGTDHSHNENCSGVHVGASCCQTTDIRGAICSLTSRMLDNPDSVGIYPTSSFYDDLEMYICSLISHAKQEGRLEVRDEYAHTEGIKEGKAIGVSQWLEYGRKFGYADFFEKKFKKEERERINQYFADKADYDTETDCTIITDRVYHKAFNPDGCDSNGENGKNLCTDCYKPKPLSTTSDKEDEK